MLASECGQSRDVQISMSDPLLGNAGPLHRVGQVKISKDAEKPWFSVNFLHTLCLDADMLRVYDMLRRITGIRFEGREGQS